MPFLQIVAAYLRSESLWFRVETYKVKYCFRTPPLQKSILLEDPTATEFSYQLLDRTHDMIGSVYHITSEDMSAT